MTSAAPLPSRLCSLDGNLGEMKSTTVPKRAMLVPTFFFFFFFEENLQLTMRYSQAESPTRITRGSSVKEECQSTSYLPSVSPPFNNVMYNIVIYIFLYRAVVLYTSFIHLRILGNKSRQGRYFILKGKRMPFYKFLFHEQQLLNTLLWVHVSRNVYNLTHVTEKKT